MFWRKNDNTNKNNLDSDEFIKLTKRIVEGDSRTAILEANLRILRTDLENLRGNFNRKLKGLSEEEKKEAVAAPTESFNNSNDVYFG